MKRFLFASALWFFVSVLSACAPAPAPVAPISTPKPANTEVPPSTIVAPHGADNSCLFNGSSIFSGSAVRLADRSYEICNEGVLIHYTQSVLPKGIAFVGDFQNPDIHHFDVYCFQDPLNGDAEGTPSYTQDANDKANFNTCALHQILGDTAIVHITDPSPFDSLYPDPEHQFKLESASGFKFYLNHLDIADWELPTNTALVWHEDIQAYVIQSRRFIESKSSNQ